MPSLDCLRVQDRPATLVLLEELGAKSLGPRKNRSDNTHLRYVRGAESSCKIYGRNVSSVFSTGVEVGQVH